MVTDEKYNWLSEQVYWVENARNDVRYHLKDTLRYFYSPENQELGQFQVLSVKDNQTNGMQAMAVAPIINGKVDTSQIVVAYAGTNQDDEHDIDTDVQMVIGGNTKKLGTDATTIDGSLQVYNTFTDSQLVTAKQFYKQVKKAYPDARLTTTGHSLGAYLALVVAAENKVPATTFNGPDPIRAMSEKAVKWVKANNHLYNNYRIKEDLIGNFGAYHADSLNTDKLGISRLVDGTRKGLLGKHSLSSFRFNKAGQVITKKGDVVGNPYLSSGAYQANIAVQKDLKKLQELKTKWEKTGGKLSPSEELFLDAGQAYLIGKGMADVAKSGSEDMQKLGDKFAKEIEALWDKIDFSRYSPLTPFEVQDIFASEGVTYDRIVSRFQDDIADKVSDMTSVSSEIETIQSKLDQAIEEKLSLDTQLGKEFKTWYQER